MKKYTFILKKARYINDYTKDILAYIDNNIKTKYEYKILFLNDNFKYSEILDILDNNYENVLIWDKNLIKFSTTFIKENNTFDNVIIFESDRNMKYNTDSSDFNENTAFFYNVKILYLREFEDKKFDMITNNYKYNFDNNE